MCIILTFAQLIYTTQNILGYNVGLLAHGLANNGMTDEQRSALSPDDPEFGWRCVEDNSQGMTAPTKLMKLQSYGIQNPSRRLDHRHVFTLDPEDVHGDILFTPNCE